MVNKEAVLTYSKIGWSQAGNSSRDIGRSGVRGDANKVPEKQDALGNRQCHKATW